MGLLLALMRLLQLLLTTILALSRLDECIFTLFRDRDQGYASFLAMALMLNAFEARPCDCAPCVSLSLIHI